MANPEWLTIQNRHAKEVNNLKEQITTLREQLKKHGGHTDTCASDRYVRRGKCDCGWAEIAKGL